ncbi:anti-anti-sigma factor [Streptomyces luteogriseus]|uniref:STAS domain-containing protein n=1 Tax=Streptomyces luteogriseus TaxID=68233 RepID=UPI00277ED5C8|nr:STAS domain-containing protein [Streptomyces luteogriseus]MDQ0712269.1 anti-anti-sigma factor [Streptomyces luteogriseus]
MTTSFGTGPHTVCLALTGDLDYDTCGEALRRVRTALDGRREGTDLHLDCRELQLVDSMGLSTLLGIHRCAGRDGIAFHLDGVRPALRRLLELTGTYEYLTSPSGPGRPPGAATAAPEAGREGRYGRRARSSRSARWSATCWGVRGPSGRYQVDRWWTEPKW